MAEKLVDVIGKLSKILYKGFLILFLFFSMPLLCSLFRLKQLFEEKNGLPTSIHFFVLFFSFFENAKNLSRPDDAERRKNQRMALPEKNFQYQGRENIDVIFVSFKSLCHGRYKYRKIVLIVENRPTN